jgi:hypothetical protein
MSCGLHLTGGQGYGARVVDIPSHNTLKLTYLTFWGGRGSGVNVLIDGFGSTSLLSNIALRRALMEKDAHVVKPLSRAIAKAQC